MHDWTLPSAPSRNGAKGWTGEILSRKGAEYEVRTDEPHFGTDVHLVSRRTWSR